VAGSAIAERGGASCNLRFALAKFRPTTLPMTLVTRSALMDRLMAGAGQRLTVVVGSAGAGKSVLLSNWAEARSPAVTSWLSCDRADADPVRFWAGFIGAIQVGVPGFGADATGLLAVNSAMSADVIASIANDAAKLPAGSAIVVDDFHHAEPAVSRHMTDLVELWPAETVQLVLSARADPSLRLHRLRMLGEVRELRDHDLYFSLAETHELLANFGVEVSAADLALLHERSEGWAAALQMAALTLRGTSDPARAVRALGAGGHEIAEYFISEVLDQQPPEVVEFMLDTSVLDELTADACTAITRRHDTAALLRRIDAASLFLVALDDERTSFRCHHLARRLLRAELRARNRGREQVVQLRAAEWFESTGDVRRAARGFLAARQADRALTVIQDRVITGFLHDPAPPAPPDVSTIDPSSLLDTPDRLLGLALDLLLSGDPAHGSEYLDLLERARPTALSGARLVAVRALRFMLNGQADEAVTAALAAREIQQRTQCADEWNALISMVLLRAYAWLEDFPAVEREAAAALAVPGLTEPVKQVLVPGARALAWFESGDLAEAADAAAAADKEATRLGFGQHVFALDCLRVLAGLALERRDLDTAERLAERALSISERRWPVLEFQALLDRATIWAARGLVHQALAAVEAARPVLAGTRSLLLARADELEGLLRLSLGDPRSPVELARGLAAAPRSLLLAKIALASGDHYTAQQHLQSPSLGDLRPRRALVRQLLLAVGAMERHDSMTAGILGGALQAANEGGFVNTVVTTDPQLAIYLIEHSKQLRNDAFMEQLVRAAVEVRATQPDDATRSGRLLNEQLTAAELRVLKLLPTSTYPQIAATLFISCSTVKTHLRSVYRKLGAATRSEAIERAVSLRLL
jgi:LuxR family transcriptional regulator, maltose regulon positive regulatory protein